MRPEDLDELRAHGFDDRAIHDAVQVIGYFNYITRVADGLGVEPEDFIRNWGVRPAGRPWRNRNHFFGIPAQAMRRIQAVPA